ncbi:transcriptional regulator, gntr family [hydrocarbon metagenome]|uniref:Transcriptional regulator, gntr family n=1 Tax=hydrocarbon metagenome TaxID=938273 RepID=A0A0W8E5I9_9ZZZZ
MDYDNSQPIYMQIIDEYKKSIIRNELKKGDKIPSQREYAQRVRVNPNTVQRAYREMENMNMVETLRGQGTFIIAGEQMREQMVNDMAGQLMRHFISEMRSLGYEDMVTMDMLKQEFESLEEDE